MHFVLQLSYVWQMSIYTYYFFLCISFPDDFLIYLSSFGVCMKKLQLQNDVVYMGCWKQKSRVEPSFFFFVFPSSRYSKIMSVVCRCSWTPFLKLSPPFNHDIPCTELYMYLFLHSISSAERWTIHCRMPPKSTLQDEEGTSARAGSSLSKTHSSLNG